MHNISISTDLTIDQMYDRMYLDSSYMQDMVFLYDSDPSGKTQAQMDATNQQVQNELRMLEVDNAYRDFLSNLKDIEKFITQVVASDQYGFVLTENKYHKLNLKKVSPLGDYFHMVFKFTQHSEYSINFKYNAYVQLFFDCWLKLNLGWVVFNNPSDLVLVQDKDKFELFDFVQGMKQFELFNSFIDSIRIESKTVEFKSKISRTKEQSYKRYRRAKLYINALFNNRSTRMLVLRLDFAYQEKIAKSTSVTQAKKDLNHFFNNKRGNRTLFNGWLGYIRKMEWSPQKGIHFHMVIFFHGSLREKGNYLAQSLGEYWTKITGNRGIYWNCNNSKHKYKRYGIGMIEIDDVSKRKILLDDVVNYLTKTEQQLRSHVLEAENDRLFVMGVMPRERISQVGRPRRCVITMAA
ncbi:hypothetical protein GALL_153780 [mine drainage metagenome]|uniref:Inovirus Gp2 family protein n=1 Tax=mine drainage metagenome TaxID=410659 RepID=A0A1J5SL50_9ZZZZ